MKGFDVVIIGGGLSGSNAAFNLSKKGYSVLIIEKEKFQDYKPCAGGMASSMQKYIPIDITDSIESKIKNVEFRWKASDNVTADLTGESPFWIVKREKLDQLLLDESLSNGAQIMRPLLIEKIIKKNDKWEINCNNKKKIYYRISCNCRWVSIEMGELFQFRTKKTKICKHTLIKIKRVR